MGSRLLALLVIWLVPFSFGQIAGDRTGNIRVRIVYENGRRCTIHAHLVLMAGASSDRITDAYTNDECMSGFDNLMVGNYHIVVSGDGIQDTDSGLFEVDNRKTSQVVYITVKSELEQKQTVPHGSGPTVAAVDLRIPKKASKEFDKASDLIAKENWAKAKEQLEKALLLYPNYAEAYNNLGVVYGHLGERDQERVALQRATRLNDHFAPAFVNLGKMAIVDRNFPDAETWLTKAATIDPENSQTLMLLANVELLNQHFGEAIANCHKVHSMQHGSQTLVHYIAARAFERENRPVEAIGELHTFLAEEPAGPRADAVRKEMAALEHHPN